MCPDCKNMKIIGLFAPCGDMITCEVCYIEKYKNKDSKCPKCKREIKSFVNKVY